MNARFGSFGPRLWGEVATVVVVVGAAYTWLLSPIMVDDVQRYIDELGTNRFYWDIGHVWMQPLALVVYRLSGGTLGIIGTLEALSVASVAIGCGVFYDMLRRCGHDATKSVAATALVAVSFNLLSLGPTAHIKLMVLPALALALRHAVLWEKQIENGRTSSFHAIASGAWLGVAANLLVSVLPAGVFVGAMMLWKVRKSGAVGWNAAAGKVLPFAAALALSGASLILMAYMVAVSSESTRAADFVTFVLGGLKEKQDLHVGVTGWKEIPFRFVYSLINNFQYLPSLGPLGRAWLWGLLPDVRQVALELAGQAVLACLAVLALAGTFGMAAVSIARPASGLVSASAFVLGAAGFSAYYNLNDPEHWFQFTMPIAFLAVQLKRRWLDRLVLAVWMPTLLVVNLWGYGIPKATFELIERQQILRQALGHEGLYVGFAGYPGEPDSSLFDLGGIERFRIDLVQEQDAKRSTSRLLELLDRRVDAAHARGGRVLVFRALDTYDWRGPVMHVTRRGLRRADLQSHLTQRYKLVGPMDVAGFQAWEIVPR